LSILFFSNEEQTLGRSILLLRALLIGHLCRPPCVLKITTVTIEALAGRPGIFHTSPMHVELKFFINFY